MAPRQRYRVPPITGNKLTTLREKPVVTNRRDKEPIGEQDLLHVRLLPTENDLVAAHDETGSTLYVSDQATPDEIGQATLDALHRANPGRVASSRNDADEEAPPK